MRSRAAAVVLLPRREPRKKERARWREALDVFEWRDAIRSARGPSNPTTRLVLLNLSLWINPGEMSCYPSQETQARQTGLSLRAVKHHLQLADHGGWIYRSKKRTRGKQWALSFYEPTIPVEDGSAQDAPA
jgi:hypothetical protein